MKKVLIPLALGFVLGAGVLASCSEDDPVKWDETDPIENPEGGDQGDSDTPDDETGDKDDVNTGDADDGNFGMASDATEVPSGFFKNKAARLPLPTTLKTIGSEAFYACLNDYVVVPEGVTAIGSKAFCKGSVYTTANHETVRNEGRLKFLYLPSSLKSIGEYAFVGVNHNIPGLGNWFADYPNIVVASSSVPSSFLKGIFVEWTDLDNMEDSKAHVTLYVPSEGVSAYRDAVEARIAEVTVDDLKPLYRSKIKIVGYDPVKIDISSDKVNDGQVQLKWNASDNNLGKISEVRWVSMDESKAVVTDNGLVTIKSPGSVYFDCVVSTGASDGSLIDFHFYTLLP